MGKDRGKGGGDRDGMVYGCTAEPHELALWIVIAADEIDFAGSLEGSLDGGLSLFRFRDMNHDSCSSPHERSLTGVDLDQCRRSVRLAFLKAVLEPGGEP